MENQKRLRIGVNAWAYESEKSSKNAGISRAVAYLVEAMAKAAPQHDFLVYCLPRVEPHESWRLPNITIKRIWPRFRTWLILGEPITAIRERADIWISLANHTPNWMPCPLAFFVHDLFPFRYPQFFLEHELPFYRKYMPRACKRSNLLFANSEATKRDVMEIFGIPSEKIVVSYLGPGNNLPARSYESVTKAELDEMGVPFDKFFLSVSTLEPRKNMAALIEAMAQVPETHGLVLAGGRGWKDDAIFEMVHRLGLEKRVHFPGYVSTEQLAALYARCETFVCASLDEGFGLPLLEAMLVGAPVISSNGGALPEVGGDAAKYFDPTKIDDIARALNESIQSTQDRQELIERGRKQAAKFTWENTGRIITSSLEKLAKA